MVILLQLPATEASYDGGHVVHAQIRGIDEHIDALLARADATQPTARVCAFADHCRRTLAHPCAPTQADTPAGAAVASASKVRSGR